MKKYFLIALLGIASVSASAQSRYESTATTDKSESRYSGQADVYIQDGWGVGGMFRKEINKMDEDTFNKYMDYVYKVSNRKELIGIGSHIVDIVRK